MISGLAERLTTGGIPVLRLLYPADPRKRPGTAAGDAWLTEAVQGYPGGTTSARWRKEMECDYGALGGTFVFPEWESWVNAGRIVMPPFVPIGYRLYGSYDHGWRNPACYHVHGVNGEGEIVTLWEFYADHVPVGKIAQLIKGEAIVLPDGRRFVGNPYHGQEVWKVADPSMWAEDQPMSDNTNKSLADLFRRSGVFFLQGERGADTMVAEWLHGFYWLDPMQPLYRITTACPKLMWELGKLRHKEVSAVVAVNREQPEALVDKDNHAWDGLKMFLKRFPPKAEKERAKERPASFEWWREQVKRANQGLPMKTYKRDMVG